MSWNYRPLSCGRDTLTTSSSSCALRDLSRPQSALNGTMYSNWPAPSPIHLLQNSIPAPWWSGAACEPGQTKQGTRTTARSGSSSDGSTPHATAATYRRCCRASAAPQDHHVPSPIPSWSSAWDARAHVMLSFCAWRLRQACGAWRSLELRVPTCTRMPTAGTYLFEAKAIARAWSLSWLTWLRQSSRAAQQPDSTRFPEGSADTWHPTPSHRSGAASCPTLGRSISSDIGTQRRRTPQNTTCSRFVSSLGMRRSRRLSATSHHPPELATLFSMQLASNRQHSQTTRHCQHRQLNRHCWQCQPSTIPTER